MTPELFVIPVPLIVKLQSLVIVKALAPASKISSLTFVPVVETVRLEPCGRPVLSCVPIAIDRIEVPRGATAIGMERESEAHEDWKLSFIGYCSKSRSTHWTTVKVRSFPSPPS